MIGANLDEAIEEDILTDREIVRRYGLKGFTQIAWSIIEPATTYIHNWHLDVMAEHLEAV